MIPAYMTFARRFARVNEKASKDDGFFYNDETQRLEYFLGPYRQAQLPIEDLGSDPDQVFEEWSDKVLCRERSHG